MADFQANICFTLCCSSSSDVSIIINQIQVILEQQERVEADDNGYVCYIFLLMDELHSGPFLTVELIRKSTSKPDEVFSLDTPSLTSAKRRKSKLLTNRKTNEQLIQEAHEELLKYIDSVEGRVQSLVQTHEGEFLEAYRQHVKKVRDQMDALRRQSSHNANSQQVHLQRIDALQKQLYVFREESLKLFQKVVAREKEISQLNTKLKEAQADSAQSRKSLQALARRNKELQAALMKTQQKDALNDNLNAPASRREEQSSNKLNALLSPLSKQLFTDDKVSVQKRPFTSAYGTHSKALSLRVQSNQKLRQPIQLQQLRERLQEKSGQAKLVSVQTVIQLLSQPANHQHNEKRSLASYRLTREKLYSKATSRNSSFSKDPIVKAQSSELAQRNDYLSIFKRCVEDVKKDIMRKNIIPSLNFFKQNGPKDFIEFKRIDHYQLLELFLRDELILKTFYSLVFRNGNE